MFRLIWMIALLLALTGRTVHAQYEPPGAASPTRIVWVVDAGLKGYAGDTPADWTMVCPATAGAIGYSMNPKIAIALRAGQEWANRAHEVELGPKWYLVGPPAESFRLSVGVNAAYLHGEGNDRFVIRPDGSRDHWSWNLPVVAGYHLTGPLWAKASGRYDPKHEDVTALLMLSLNAAIAREDGQ